MSRLPGTLARVRELLAHPAFDLKVPNKVYALIRAFGSNHVRFHAADGGGYAFLADQVIALDALNPQVAARMARALRPLEEVRRGQEGACARAARARARRQGPLEGRRRDREQGARLTQLVARHASRFSPRTSSAARRCARRWCARSANGPTAALYSLVALATLVWMGFAYAAAPRELLWNGLRHLPSVVMPLAFVLITCGAGRNPTIVGADKLLKSDEPARGIVRITRHPIMWGLMLWSASHVLARGDLKSLVFFGGLFLLAALGTVLIDCAGRKPARTGRALPR